MTAPAKYATPLLSVMLRRSQDPAEFSGMWNAPIIKVSVVTPSSSDLADADGVYPRALFATADCTVNGKDGLGNAVTALPLNKGRNDVVMTVISSVSTGTVTAGW